MPDYVTASRTKDHFEAQLLRDHAEIVSIAPRLLVDAHGQATQEAVVVIGVKKLNPLRFGPGAAPRPPAAGLPLQLPAITSQGAEDRTQAVDVIVEDEGEVVLESFTAQRRPCPGGYSVGHPVFLGGTLGGVARADAEWGFILSNNHVLAAENAAAVGDAILQPGVVDGGAAADAIGRLDRWVHVNVAGGNNEADCALAKANDPWKQAVDRHVEGIGTPAAVAEAAVGQAVRKSGRTTRVTTGTVVSDNATVRMGSGAGPARIKNALGAGLPSERRC